MFKSVGWTMRSIILAPAEASTYHHVPMSCPPLKSILSTICSRSGLLLQTFRSTRCHLRGLSRQSGPPSPRYPSRGGCGQTKNLVYPCRLTKRKSPKSRSVSQGQWAQMLLAHRSVAWQCMDREIVPFFQVQISTRLGSKNPPGSLSDNLSSECTFGPELA